MVKAGLSNFCNLSFFLNKIYAIQKEKTDICSEYIKVQNYFEKVIFPRPFLSKKSGNCVLHFKFFGFPKQIEEHFCPNQGYILKQLYLTHDHVNFCDDSSRLEEK